MAFYTTFLFVYIIRAVWRYVNNFFIDFEKINFYAEFRSFVSTSVGRYFSDASVNALARMYFIIMINITIFNIILYRMRETCAIYDDFDTVKTIFPLPNFMLFYSNFLHKKIKNV